MIVDVTAEIRAGHLQTSQEHCHLVFANIVIIHQDEAFVPPRPY
jgi:hypothetical protein